MIREKKIVVALPAYNAERTLRLTWEGIPRDIVDEVILTDDGSSDRTVAVAKDLGIRTLLHERNRGYGANQKTSYAEALRTGAEIVVMLHPDYQYDPRLIRAMASMIAEEIYDVVIGSRILGGGAIAGGMPRYKYIANRLLTLVQNLVTGRKLSEYHTGYRAFARRVLLALPLLENSDDFVFDNQMLAQAIFFGFRVGEVSCPASYHDASSSISFARAITYGSGCLTTTLEHLLARLGWARPSIFDPNGRKLEP
jgi:glycosyltransferase involved in cell wall biosynthesis